MHFWSSMMIRALLIVMGKKSVAKIGIILKVGFSTLLSAFSPCNPVWCICRITASLHCEAVAIYVHLASDQKNLFQVTLMKLSYDLCWFCLISQSDKSSLKWSNSTLLAKHPSFVCYLSWKVHEAQQCSVGKNKWISIYDFCKCSWPRTKDGIL